jgi:hypothetical protein
VKLQGKIKLLSDKFSDVKAFEMKLKLLHKQKTNETWTTFLFVKLLWNLSSNHLNG